MSFAAWAYFLFTLALGVVFAGILLHTFAPKRRDAVEAPKFRMLADDEEPSGEDGSDRRSRR